MLRRRGFLRAVRCAALAAPAIVRAPGLLMPIKRLVVVDRYLVCGDLNEANIEALLVEIRRWSCAAAANMMMRGTASWITRYNEPGELVHERIDYA